MKEALYSLAEKHPIAAGAIGAASGLGSKVLEHLHWISGVAADVGVIFGCATAVLTFCIVLGRWRRQRGLDAAAIARNEERDRHGDLPWQ